IASGNPAVLTLAEADAEIKRLTVLKKKHMDEQYVVRRNVRDLPGTIARLTERLQSLRADAATAAAHADDATTVGSDTCLREELLAPLGAVLESVPARVPETRRFPLGVYRGLEFGLMVHPHFPPDIYLEGTTAFQSGLLREHHGPRAIFNALERLAGNYETECDRIKRDISVAESQLHDYQKRFGMPFEEVDFFAQLARLRDLLKLSLSDADDKTGTASPAEVAAQINRLRASHSAETSTSSRLQSTVH